MFNGRAGPEGLRTRTPHQLHGLDDPCSIQAHCVSVRPVLPSLQLHSAQPSADVAACESVPCPGTPLAALPRCSQSKSLPLARTAQATRAFLFASATAATFLPRRQAKHMLNSTYPGQAAKSPAPDMARSDLPACWTKALVSSDRCYPRRLTPKLPRTAFLRPTGAGESGICESYSPPLLRKNQLCTCAHVRS